jgi:hypothetical protein
MLILGMGALEGGLTLGRLTALLPQLRKCLSFLREELDGLLEQLSYPNTPNSVGE